MVTKKIVTKLSRQPENTTKTRWELRVYGLVNSNGLDTLCRNLGRACRAKPHLVQGLPEVFPLLEADWSRMSRKLKHYTARHSSDRFCCASAGDTSALFCNSRYIGGTEAAVNWICAQFAIAPPVDMDGPAACLTSAITAPSSPPCFVYLRLAIGGHQVPRSLVFQLFVDQVPLTCSRFVSLCQSGHSPDTASYRQTRVSRIVPGGWVQMGAELDPALPPLADENYAVRHTCRGRVSFVADQRHSARAQFMIALGAMPYMQGKAVAFGQLVRGAELLHRLENIRLVNQKPYASVVVTECGIYPPPADQLTGDEYKTAFVKHKTSASLYDTQAASDAFSNFSTRKVQVNAARSVPATCPYKYSSSVSLFDLVAMATAYENEKCKTLRKTNDSTRAVSMYDSTVMSLSAGLSASQRRRTSFYSSAVSFYDCLAMNSFNLSCSTQIPASLTISRNSDREPKTKSKPASSAKSLYDLVYASSRNDSKHRSFPQNLSCSIYDLTAFSTEPYAFDKSGMAK